METWMKAVGLKPKPEPHGQGPSTKQPGLWLPASLGGVRLPPPWAPAWHSFQALWQSVFGTQHPACFLGYSKSSDRNLALLAMLPSLTLPLVARRVCLLSSYPKPLCRVPEGPLWSLGTRRDPSALCPPPKGGMSSRGAGAASDQHLSHILCRWHLRG